MEPSSAWLEEITALHLRIKDGDRSYETDAQLTQAIGQARKFNATWQQIGDAMGTSRQYVHKRFATVIES